MRGHLNLIAWPDDNNLRQFCSASIDRDAYVGSQTAKVTESVFGTIVAPNAELRLIGLEAVQTSFCGLFKPDQHCPHHEGEFFAKNIFVGHNVAVESYPFTCQ
jgi:hypothetical protein